MNPPAGVSFETCARVVGRCKVKMKPERNPFVLTLCTCVLAFLNSFSSFPFPLIEAWNNRTLLKVSKPLQDSKKDLEQRWRESIFPKTLYEILTMYLGSAFWGSTKGITRLNTSRWKYLPRGRKKLFLWAAPPLTSSGSDRDRSKAVIRMRPKHSSEDTLIPLVHGINDTHLTVCHFPCGPGLPSCLSPESLLWVTDLAARILGYPSQTLILLTPLLPGIFLHDYLLHSDTVMCTDREGRTLHKFGRLGLCSSSRPGPQRHLNRNLALCK